MTNNGTERNWKEVTRDALLAQTFYAKREELLRSGMDIDTAEVAAKNYANKMFSETTHKILSKVNPEYSHIKKTTKRKQTGVKWLDEQPELPSCILELYEKPSILSRIYTYCVVSYAALVSIVTIPIVILNIASLPISFIWLCVLGYWKLAIWGAIAWAISTPLLGFITLPSSLLSVFSVRILNFRIPFRMFVSFIPIEIGMIYTHLVFGAWSILIINYLSKSVSDIAILPALILSYTLSVSPVQGMCDPKKKNISEFLHVFCVILGVFAMSALVLLKHGSILNLIEVSIVTMVPFVLIQSWMKIQALKSLYDESDIE